MKFIHTSDWHIGRSLCGVSLLEDQQHFLRQFTEYLEQEQPDAVVIAGDLYDRPVPSAEAMELLDEFFSKTVLELKIPVLAVAGNHDSGQRLAYERDFLAKAGLHMAGTLTNPVETVALSDEWGPVYFHLLPWLDPAAVNSLFREEERVRTMQEAFDRMTEAVFLNVKPGGRNILVCHGYFSMGSGSSQAEELGGSELVELSAYRDFSYIAAGHIHRKMPAGPNLRYCGSILKYSPNEIANRPSVTLAEVGQDGEAHWQEVSFPPLHDMRKIAGSFAELMGSDKSEDYIFAELTDPELVLDPARRLRERFPNLLGVAYTQREQASSAFTVEAEQAKSLSISELFSQFYQEITGVPLSEDALKLVSDAAHQAEKEAHE